MDLVIMAGGLGSRFGGLKQIEPIDEHGNFIIDYSVYDAIRCGFEKVIFVINKDNLEAFDNTIGKRVKSKIKVEYAFQENPFSNLRTKPLGTAHAVLSAKDKISDKFVVINADDFYGYESIKLAKQSLEKLNKNEYAMICFEAQKTLSKFGTVKRGICKVDEQNNLATIEESLIYTEGGDIFASKINDNQKFKIKGETLVSMNLWAFDLSFLKFLEKGFEKFCESEENLKSKEYFLPGVVETVINNYNYKVKVLKTSDTWFGMTYREDKEDFMKNLENLKRQKIYPENLWN